MNSKPYPKLNTFTLTLVASGLLGLVGGCPTPFCTSDADCDDALFCNGVEVCGDGACLSNGNPCPADEICDEDNNVCIVPCQTDADCADADACTDDACNDDGECDHTNSAAACDDGDACTVNDTCADGTCDGTAMDCDDGLFCTGTETCDSATGCVDGTEPCDPDSEQCNEDTDSCDTVCEDNADCDDIDACTTDSCVAGICANVAVDCDPGQACNGLTGACNTTCAVDSDCDDRLFCNGTETCVDGLCEPGTFPCKASEMCLVDTDECVPLGLVFFDDFEGGIGNWSADNGIWEVGVPSSGPNSAHSPENVAATVLAGNYPSFVSSRLVSPSLQLPVVVGGDEIHLRFWHWFAFARGASCLGCGGDSGVVQIRERTASGEWGAWASLGSFARTSGVYTRALVDLSGYAGKKVQLAFLLSQGWTAVSAGWYIDDVTIDVF